MSIDMSMTLDQARALAETYASRGVPALPIAVGYDTAKGKTTKRPLTPHGHKDAATDLERVRYLFNRYGAPRDGEVLGVGLHLGGAGWFALDGDRDARGDGVAELEQVLAEHGITGTVLVHTASDGRHAWLDARGRHIGNASPFTAVDVRGHDGWVVAPGTHTPWGEWRFDTDADLNDGVAPIPAPDTLLSRLGATTDPRVPAGVGDRRVPDHGLDPRDRAALDALEALGGRYSHRDATSIHVTRPGKTAGTSATVGHIGPGVVKVFTSNWPPLESGRVYDADQLVALAAGDKRPVLDVAEGAAEQVLRERHILGPDGYRYSDAGNAGRFVERHGEHVRYVPTWRRWIIYRAGRWQIDPDGTVVGHLAAKLGADLLDHLAEVRHNTDAVKALLRHAKTTESARGAAATLQLAAGVPGVAVDHDSLDADGWLLNVRNGTVDLRTGRLGPHDPGQLLTMRAGVDYQPDAEAPEWQRFLEVVLPDPAVRGLVQRIAGLALVGEQLEHLLPIAIGNGANGKSTLTSILAGVLGDYAVVASRDLLLAMRHDSHPTARADLFRRRFAHSGEIPAGARLDEAGVKELTGGDEIKARRMREDFWSFQPSHTLWLHANHRPVITGTDDGIWRRVLLVPFAVTVPPGDRDPHLARRIVRAEGPGVLRWMLDGLADYLEHGLRPPDAVQAATNAYRAESDTVTQFLTEAGLTVARGLTIASNHLTSMHSEWFTEAGVGGAEAGHWQRVTTRLRELGAEPKRSKKGRYWTGVGVADEVEGDAGDAPSGLFPSNARLDDKPEPASPASPPSISPSHGTAPESSPSTTCEGCGEGYLVCICPREAA